MFHKSHFKNYLFFISGILVAIVISSIVLAWREPEVNPPEGQVRGTRSVALECKGVCGEESSVKCPQGWVEVKRVKAKEVCPHWANEPREFHWCLPIAGGIWSITGEQDANTASRGILPMVLRCGGIEMARTDCASVRYIEVGFHSYIELYPLSNVCLICCR